jgi:hypothetical protein
MLMCSCCFIPFCMLQMVAAAADYTAASDQFTAAEQRPSTMKAAAARLRAAAQAYDKQVIITEYIILLQ